jgi:hypothetical protein
MPQPRRTQGRSGVPLAAVFLLIATIAVFLAMLRSQQDVGIREKEIEAAEVLCGVWGALTGALTGLGQAKRLQFGFLGAIVGIGFGVVAGRLLVAPGDFRIAGAGCVILLAIGLTVRRFSRPAHDAGELAMHDE